MRARTMSVALALLVLLATGCNAILGMNEGKPYPPDAGSGLTSTFVSGAVEGQAGSVALSGRIVWHGKVEGKAGDVELKGGLE